jgi:hypothetical protein
MNETDMSSKSLVVEIRLSAVFVVTSEIFFVLVGLLMDLQIGEKRVFLITAGMVTCESSFFMDIFLVTSVGK